MPLLSEFSEEVRVAARAKKPVAKAEGEAFAAMAADADNVDALIDRADKLHLAACRMLAKKGAAQ